MTRSSITMTRRGWIKACVLELFVVAKDSIPHGYSEVQLVESVLDEMLFLNSFKGDQSEFQRFREFLSTNSALLYGLYVKILSGAVPTVEDVDFIDGYEVLRDFEHIVPEPSPTFVAVSLKGD